MHSFVSRTLFLRSRATGEEAESSIVIFEPYLVDDGANAFCEADVFGEHIRVGGIDPLQAVSLLFRRIHTIYNEKKKDDAIFLQRGDMIEMESIDAFETAERFAR